MFLFIPHETIRKPRVFRFPEGLKKNISLKLTNYLNRKSEVMYSYGLTLAVEYRVFFIAVTQSLENMWVQEWLKLIAGTHWKWVCGGNSDISVYKQTRRRVWNIQKQTEVRKDERRGSKKQSWILKKWTFWLLNGL